MTSFFQLDYYSLFLFLVGFASLIGLLAVNDRFVPTMLVIINTLAWEMIGRSVRVE